MKLLKTSQTITGKKVYRYNEKNVFSDLDAFYTNLYSQSFFDKNKLIIISEVVKNKNRN